MMTYMYDLRIVNTDIKDIKVSECQDEQKCDA